MPFKSKSQQRYLWATNPKVAKKFAEHTPKSAYSDMPEYAGRDKNRLMEISKKYRGKNNE